ncbi:hypothetical protein AKJ09_06723 [Labilithrix luteola]|uniref:Uncharacterized protein n=1 Tax=Labilithrix luteola TaxID=1391654 RepID=A0A0K1Q3U3_9BACT|nr:hypothetical protein AKJ09_06723 [Labilithrix luteola]
MVCTVAFIVVQGCRGPRHASGASACDTLRDVRRAACAKRADAISRDPGYDGKVQDARCMSDCAPDTSACLETRDGAWDVVVDERTCIAGLPYEAGPERTTWRLLHLGKTARSVRSSGPQSSVMPPRLEMVGGQVRVSFTERFDYTCMGSATTPSLLDCLGSRTLRRPAWLPEHMSVQSGRPDSARWEPGKRWDSGSQSLMLDENGRARVSLEAMPLDVHDDDVSSWVLAGPTLRGSVDDAGVVSFDAPEDLASDRAECNQLPSPSKAHASSLWRSALCSRLQGQPVAWIVREWNAKCASWRKGADDEYELAGACRVDADNLWSNTKGVPKIVVHYLEQVTPWPTPAGERPPPSTAERRR